MVLRNLSSQAFQAKSEELNFRIYKRVIPRAFNSHYSLNHQSPNMATTAASNERLKAVSATPNQQLANVVPTPIWNDPLKNGTALTDLQLPNTEEVSTLKDPSNAGSPTPNQELANAAPILT
jgi:hypothetical protein